MTKKSASELSEEELIREFTEEATDDQQIATSTPQNTETTDETEEVVQPLEDEEPINTEKTLEELQITHYEEESTEKSEDIVAEELPVMSEPKDTFEICKDVLEKNKHGDYTVPADGLYPHQWLWDSCFIAIGLAEYDIDRAKKEIQSLLRGQWANGMLPNIIFADGDAHKRDRKIWQSWRSPFAPEGVATTGITQPPMLAEAVWRIGKKMNLTDRRNWFQLMYPSIVAYHEWLYVDRDPHDEGLALLIHPYECGLDNTPPWINQMHMHHKPWWIGLIERTHTDNLGNLFRRDTKRVPPGQRISNIEALMYYNVIRRLRAKNWDTEAILARSHFVVQDLTFNSILLRAGTILQDIAKTIGHELPEALVESHNKGKETLEKLWDGYSSQYYSRNFITHRLIKEVSIATLMPLYAGTISPERAEQLVKILKNNKSYDTAFPIASVPTDSQWYKEFGYWQGPTWINTNWLIAEGLERYGYKDEAKRIRDLSIELVNRHGASEYFSALSGEPAGAQNFSWTASLIISMMKTK